MKAYYKAPTWLKIVFQLALGDENFRGNVLKTILTENLKNKYACMKCNVL